MKQFVLALTAAAAVLLGTVGVADAYPPNGANVVVEPATVAPGASVKFTANCTVGETVTFSLGNRTTTAVCVANTNGSVGGTATGTVNAPTTPGIYTGTAGGSISGVLGAVTVTVSASTPTNVAPTGALPATGSGGTSTMTIVAGGLLVVGLAMFGVATVRRRQATSAG